MARRGEDGKGLDSGRRGRVHGLSSPGRTAYCPDHDAHKITQGPSLDR